MNYIYHKGLMLRASQVDWIFELLQKSFINLHTLKFDAFHTYAVSI